MKKLWIIGLILFLVACGGDDDSAKKDKKTATPTKNVPSEPIPTNIPVDFPALTITPSD